MIFIRPISLGIATEISWICISRSDLYRYLNAKQYKDFWENLASLLEPPRYQAVWNHSKKRGLDNENMADLLRGMNLFLAAREVTVKACVTSAFNSAFFFRIRTDSCCMPKSIFGAYGILKETNRKETNRGFGFRKTFDHFFNIFVVFMLGCGLKTYTGINYGKKPQ